MELKKTICMQCHNACRLAAEVEGDRLLSVESDETFPGTKSSYPITKGCPAGMDSRVVHVQHGRWYPEEEGVEPSLHGVWKSNCNVLTDDDPDICNPISGGWPLRTLLCKVTKALVHGKGNRQGFKKEGTADRG
jgi:anaerobic selenocysteine-containing dehydrogenase